MYSDLIDNKTHFKNHLRIIPHPIDTDPNSYTNVKDWLAALTAMKEYEEYKPIFTVSPTKTSTNFINLYTKDNKLYYLKPWSFSKLDTTTHISTMTALYRMREITSIRKLKHIKNTHRLLLRQTRSTADLQVLIDKIRKIHTKTRCDL